MNDFNWNKSFGIDFNTSTGLSKIGRTSKRRLSHMKGIFHDTDVTNAILEKEDPLVYEFYELGCPERIGDLAFGTTIIYPGRVGNEYYMTKGHFHTIVDTAEVYYTLEGEGYMVMENQEGDTIEMPLFTGQAVYVPRRYAHRTVNTGEKELVLFFAFPAQAGHDYGTIETKGFHKMVIEKDGKSVVVDNLKWK